MSTRLSGGGSNKASGFARCLIAHITEAVGPVVDVMSSWFPNSEGVGASEANGWLSKLWSPSGSLL